MRPPSALEVFFRSVAAWGNSESLRGKDGWDAAYRLKRYFPVGHHRLVLIIAFGFLIPIALGIEELDSIGIDEVSVVLGARLLVILGFSTLAAFDVCARAFVEMKGSGIDVFMLNAVLPPNRNWKIASLVTHPTATLTTPHQRRIVLFSSLGSSIYSIRKASTGSIEAAR